MKPLECPNDASHQLFRGSLRTYTKHEIEVDPNRATLRRLGSTDLGEMSEVSDHAIFCAHCGAEVWEKRKPISFTPVEGTVLLCNFVGFDAAEMTKIRPVVIISAEKRNRRNCLVVPISSVVSLDPRAITVALTKAVYPFLFADSWAKCHSASTVNVKRLFLMRAGPRGASLRSEKTKVSSEDLTAIRQGVGRFAGLP